jgi:hypothetical protein
MPFLKSSQITGLSPKPIDVTGFTQSASEDLEGTYSQHEVLLADAFNVTDNVTISDNLILTKLSDDGNAITLTGNATTTRTITGSGSLEGSTFAQTPNASLTGMTGTVPTSTLTSATFPTGHVIQVQANPDNALSQVNNSTTTLVDVSGCDVQLTPKFTSSNVVIFVSFNIDCGGNTQSMSAGLSQIINGVQSQVTGSGDGIYGQGIVTGAARHGGWMSFNYFNSPATTSTITYRMQFNSGGSYVTYFNRRTLRIIVMEIAA